MGTGCFSLPAPNEKGTGNFSRAATAARISPALTGKAACPLFFSLFFSYDNASCESFIKTLKREEIYANEYRDLDHLRLNIEVFIDQYYNRQRLHSALGYQAPEEFEGTLASPVTSLGATLRVFRPEERSRRQRAAGQPTSVPT
ncbi:MAG TPA: integrase core domain-containing protein [Nitrospiria bacterium]|nr:integrase core domain-containing protein [Nitrospiria bacterium]